MVNVKLMSKRFGNSNEESRKAVIDAHDGKENLKNWALEWARHHKLIWGSVEDISVAYATAVDLGYRIGKTGG